MDDTRSINNTFSNGEYAWFVGEVIDIDDPDKDGRVRVKIFGYHPDTENQLSKDDTPWAMVELSAMSSSVKTFGFGPHALVVGTIVKGHFLDGHDAQLPMVTGTFYGEGETHPLIRGDSNSLNKALLSGGGIKEPKSEYAAKYPNNKVLSTTSGHIIEIDDTPGKERLHIYHKSGTFIEIFPDGRTVYHHKKDSFFLTEGNCSQITNGNYKHFVTGNYELEIGGNFTVKANGSGNIQVGSSMNIKSGGSTNIQAGGSATLRASGTVTVRGSVINLN